MVLNEVCVGPIPYPVVTMKLNHVNIAVPDVAATRAFFENFFGLKCTETKGENVLSVLVDGEGFVLILSNFEKQVTPQYPRDFHLGFLLRESVDQVNELYQRLRASGIEAAPPKKFHGSWGFYVVAPGGITVEVSSYPEEASAR
jgi:catechol 2,3-dioxygenase-like lactoylglutathione lyase family enzyme